jgi:hypothetical protein
MIPISAFRKLEISNYSGLQYQKNGIEGVEKVINRLICPNRGVVSFSINFSAALH